MLSVDEDTSPFGGIDIYVEVGKFQDSCEKLNVKAGDSLLEAYEKYELIYPIYRITRPKDYLQIIFEQKYGTQNDENVISVSNEHSALFIFESEELNNWRIEILPEFDRALREGHPLDQAHKRDESFIEVPSKDTYRDWKEYVCTFQLDVNGMPIKGKESTARHFYSPWQIYLLEEANQKHTRTVNTLITLDEKESYIFNEIPQKLFLANWHEHFKSLWVYRFKKNLIFRKTLNGIEGNVLEGVDAKRYYSNRKKVAEIVYKQHSYESWIEFLKTLCSLYFDYQERERRKLSGCLKKDIKCIVELLVAVSGKTYRNIIDDVGTVLGARAFSYIPPLERILPEYESFLRREAKSSLDSILGYYNEEVPACLKLDKGAVDKIIDHAFKIGNETLLVSIIGINQEYFSPSYFGEEGIWSYVRSLSVAVESWVKEIANKNNLREGIIALATGDFDSCCDKLKKKAGKTNINVHSYIELKQFLDELKTVTFTIRTKDMTWMKYLIRAYLIRNYVAHHTKLEPGLFGKTLIDLYRSLLFLVFYTWKLR